MKQRRFIIIFNYSSASQVNVLSKIMQSVKMGIDNCLILFKKVKKFLVEFKEIGFHGSKISAKELAEELEMSTEKTTFPPAVSIKKKRTKKSFLMKPKMSQYMKKNLESIF